MINWLKKLWRRFFPIQFDLAADDPRFDPADIEKGDAREWRKFSRVYCPKCGSPTQLLGTGKINDKVRCAKRCGMRGYFDGVYIKWNHQFQDRR